MIVLVVSSALAGPMDGKTFSVTLTDPAKKADPDTLVFASDTFLSKGCEAYGFHAGPYSAAAAGDGMTVTVDQASPTEGTTRWVLTVKGTKVDGTLDWTKAGQAPVHYVVAGSLAK